MPRQAPFETFYEHHQRETSDEPYNDRFIERCRQEAQEYDKDKFLRNTLLRELESCVPHHYRGRIFEGISRTWGGTT